MKMWHVDKLLGFNEDWLMLAGNLLIWIAWRCTSRYVDMWTGRRVDGWTECWYEWVDGMLVWMGGWIAGVNGLQHRLITERFLINLICAEYSRFALQGEEHQPHMKSISKSSSSIKSKLIESTTCLSIDTFDAGIVCCDGKSKITNIHVCSGPSI